MGWHNWLPTRRKGSQGEQQLGLLQKKRCKKGGGEKEKAMKKKRGKAGI